MAGQRPRFHELGFGLHFDEPPTEAETQQFLRGTADPWNTLAAIVQRTVQGDFNEVKRVPALMTAHDNAEFWGAAAEFLGFACPLSALQNLTGGLFDQRNRFGVQYYLSLTLVNTCSLDAVSPLLVLHAAATEEEARFQIERCLSYLLESEADEIADGAEVEFTSADPQSDSLDIEEVVDAAGYANRVKAALAVVAEKAQGAGTAVLGGDVLDLRQLCETLLSRLSEEVLDKDRIYREIRVFEAFTGTDCREFYSPDGQIQQLAITASIEDFLESDEIAGFVLGQRYFFGHKVPD